MSGEVFVDFKGAAFGREIFRLTTNSLSLAIEENFEYENTNCEVDSADIGYTLAGRGINFDIDSRRSLVYIGFGEEINVEPTDDELKSVIKSWTLRNTIFPFLKEEARRFFNEA